MLSSSAVCVPSVWLQLGWLALGRKLYCVTAWMFQHGSFLKDCCKSKKKTPPYFSVLFSLFVVVVAVDGGGGGLINSLLCFGSTLYLHQHVLYPL